MLKQLARICLAGSALELVWLASVRLGPLREHAWPFLALMAAASILCLYAYLQAPLDHNKAPLLVLAFALLFRLTVVPAPPYQSEDVYRYLWDARVASAGIDPFRFPPNAPELEPLRDAVIYPMINSKSFVTAYPPLSQIIFRAVFRLFGARVTPLKAVFSLFDFGAVILAWRLIVIMGKRKEPIYLLAWNPFFIFEFSYSGHSDSCMIFLLLLSLNLLERGRSTLAMTSYAGAVLSKLHPALWFPLFLRRAGWRSAWAGALAGALMAAVYFTPHSALSYMHSLRLYYRLFEFNASIHYLLRGAGRALWGQNWDQSSGPILAACLLFIALLIWWKFPMRNTRDLAHAGFWIMTADLCLATTVHPWYLSWAAMLLFLFPYAFMIYWTAAAFLSYVAYSYRPVYEAPWILLVEYLPMYALMIWEILRRQPLIGTTRTDRRDL